MDTPSTETMEVDSKGSQISQYCLGFPTVLRQILQHFSTTDLIELSLVNKLWNFESRSLMKKRRNLRANIRKGAPFEAKLCKRLAAFTSDLENMRTVPFSGLHFTIGHPVDCKLSLDGPFQPSYQVVLERLHWKHILIQFYDPSHRCQECPALVFVKRLLEENCGVIEELIFSFGDVEFLGSVFKDLNWPRLKSLAIESWYKDPDPFTSSFIKTRISLVPNLQELQLNSNLDVMIIKQILEHFSNAQLLQLSLVNQKWNYEARTVLRNRGTLSAKIRSDHSCQRIIDFAGDLKGMRVVPFTGIQLALFRQPSPVPNGSLEESYKIILEQLPCRYFSVQFNEEWESLWDTPAFELVTNILKDYCKVLEELSFTFCRIQVEMPQQLVQEQRFPRLKTLKIEADHRATAHESLGHFLKALVSRAPKLEELHMKGSINFHENILEGTSAVLVPCLPFNPMYERVHDSLVGALRPAFIDLHPGENVELLNRHIPRVLQASVPTLHKLHMDLLFALPLMCYGICLENVAVLLMRIDDHTQNLPPRIFKLLTRFDFTRIFPKLSQVEIAAYFTSPLEPEKINIFVEQGNASFRETLPDRADHIKQLSLLHPVSDSNLPLLAQMFPHVERLFVRSRYVPFTFLREHFRHLKQVMPTCT